ncbi:MAG: hypothetical protein K1X94_17720 [Sandaracinaceae bacterium]|nr:hypothetical protein [Sandaracinaceae bacterium]
MLEPTQRTFLLLALSLMAGCGGDPREPADASRPEDARVDGGADDAGGVGEDARVVDLDAPAPSDDAPVPDSYLLHCESFFAARIVERATALDASFPSDCDEPLPRNVGLLRMGGDAMCHAGESANECRTRVYETPPALDALDQACWSGAGPAGCMRASYVPRCADGSDTCAEDEAVCQDGTRPMVYAEAATAGPSDVWLFHLGGEGGPCSGPKCWLNYRYGEPEFANAMSTLHPDNPASAAHRGAGILSGDTSLPFARLNRVQFERCTDAASTLVEIAPVGNGVTPDLAAMFPDAPLATALGHVPVWHHGFDTWRATLWHMTTMAGRDRDGDGAPELPSLADARLVILSASSDASNWVTLAADRLAAELRAIAGPDVEVRLMVDGMFPPMLDSAGRYAVGAPPSFDMLSSPYHESGLCALPDNHDGIDNESCSDANYALGGRLRSAYEARGVLFDESCEAAHGPRAAECADRNHTLVHHLGMPVLVLADQEDNTVSDNAPSHASDLAYHWESPAAYRQQILDEAWDVVDHWSTAAREEGAGPEGGFALILPKTRREGEPWGRATHVRAHSDMEMARGMTLCTPGGMRVQSATFAQMVGAWIDDTLPMTYAIEDASRSLPSGNVWVTGASCRAPE